MVRPQQPVAQRKVEDHQIDVELEVLARADAVEDGRGRHQLEVNDFAVLVFRYEIGRDFEIENEQHVIADAELVFHAIGDGTGRNRMAGEALRERGFFFTLFQQGLLEPVPVADAAGDEVVELVGRDPLIGSAPADPQMEGARLPKITVEVDAVGACSKERHGATVETDRKSTRLNSSHVSISYAVFCLKKK